MNTHARKNRSNVIVCFSVMSDPEGAEAKPYYEGQTDETMNEGGQVRGRASCVYLPNLATSSDSRCCGSFMPN
jgi:hypothetical protein